MYKHLMNVADEKEVVVQFEGLLEIDFEAMSAASVVELLSKIERDASVLGLKFSGQLDYRDVAPILQALDTLLTFANRPWKAVLFHASFGSADPEDFPKWVDTMEKANYRLKEMALETSIPIGVEYL